jgi:hypothetical protein
MARSQRPVTREFYLMFVIYQPPVVGIHFDGAAVLNFERRFE